MKVFVLIFTFALSSIGFAQITWTTQKITFNLNLTLITGPKTTDKVIVKAENVEITTFYGVNGKCSIEFHGETFDCQTRLVDWDTSNVCEGPCAHELLNDVVLPLPLLNKLITETSKSDFASMLNNFYGKQNVGYYFSGHYFRENDPDNDLVFLTNANQRFSLIDKANAKSLAFKFEVIAYEKQDQ